MSVTEITAKSILRKFKKTDSWFVARYSMNLYRGCLHNCVYCDGRAEKYGVDGEFGRDVAVKINALDLLEKELDPSRKRKPVNKGFVLLGGGVGDSYQPIEKKYELTRGALALLDRFNRPVHVLTKSTLVERDIDLLEKINKKSKALVSMSFSSMDQKISSRFEPGVDEPLKRLEFLKQIKKTSGIAIGVFLMPVIPMISDTSEVLNETMARCREAGIDYVIFSGMTLKPGRQQEHFYASLEKSYPELVNEYKCLYAKAGQWGNTSEDYYQKINHLFCSLANKYRLSTRIPLKHWQDVIDESDRVIAILEQLDYLLKLRGEASPYGYGAYSLSQLKEPIRDFQGSFTQLKGIGPVTERLIWEILNTGSCKYYEKLMS